MNAELHSLDRTVTIQAPPATVFRFFTDSTRWASWWGAGSTIDATPGGRVYIRMPGNVEVTGEVLEVVSPHRLVFTYGFVSGTPIPPGASTVTITLDRIPAGTLLRLEHAFPDAAVRDHHVQGWRYQLAVFSNVVSDEVNAGAAAHVDTWFRAWAETSEPARAAMLADVAAPSVLFKDRFSLIDGVADLMPHITAAQHFMPGMLITREGGIRHCQGTVLAEWTATSADGQPRGRGANVFVLGADGKFVSVTGLWAM